MTCACVRVCEHACLTRILKLNQRRVQKKVSQTCRPGETLAVLQTKYRKHAVNYSRLSGAQPVQRARCFHPPVGAPGSSTRQNDQIVLCHPG